MDTEWIELWVDRDGSPEPTPVRVGYSPGTIVRELSSALRDWSRPSPDTQAASLVGIDPPAGLLLDDVPIERSGLRRGQVVRLADADHAPADSGYLRTTVLVRRGPDRGRRVRLSASMVVGRSGGCGLELADPTVSRRHVRLTRRNAVVEVEPLGGAVQVNGRQLHASEPVEPGTPIRVGDSELVVLAPTCLLGTDGKTTDRPSTSHQRPPRASWTPNPPIVEIAEPPRRTGVGTVPWLSIGLTAAFAIVMVMGGGFGGGITGNLIWFFTPLLLASGAVEYAISARRGDRKARARWRADLVDQCATLGDRLDAETRREAHAAPPPSEWALAAQVASARLWERRREHVDALRLRVGLTHASAPIAGDLPTTGPPELLAEAREAVDRVRRRQDVVSSLNLSDVGSIGLHGPDAHSLASSLVAQLVSAVGPEDVALAIVVNERHADSWRWVAALPHVRSAAQLLDGPATAGVGGHEQLVATVSALGAARLRSSTGSPRRPTGEIPLVVVVDGELGDTIEVRRLAALCRLADVGIHVIWLEHRPSNTPLGCGAIITTARTGLAAVVPFPGAEPHQVRWETLNADQLELLARHLAPLRDGDRAGTGAGLPGAVSLAALPVIPHAAGSLAATVGIGPDGPVTIDLRRDGPHALVAGTTGAGKSELLRTLVGALAMTHSPKRLNFVLVDFKGGTGMGPLAQLPHVAGMITDLDLGEAKRLQLGLESEVERRLRTLATAGVENLAALERHDRVAAPPAIVLVIDEFAALARQAPDVLDGLVDLAQRGRSLGIHLVLATQRPRGVISDAIRANTNLRLVARMADAEESIDVLDDPGAALLAVGVPGRVLMRVGATAPSPLQVAFTGNPVGDRPPVSVQPLTLDPPRARPLARSATSAVTEADAVVRSTLAAAASHGETSLGGTSGAAGRSRGRRGGAQRLWLEPLPAIVIHPVTELGSGEGAQSAFCTPQFAQRWPLALADLPRRRDRGVWSLDPTGGVLLVLGSGGSGRTSTLRALAVTAASKGAAVVGIDGAGGHLAALDGAQFDVAVPDAAVPDAAGFDSADLPHHSIGAILPVRDGERLARLLWWLEQRDDSRPGVLLIDGWEGVWESAEQAGGSSWLARLLELIRTARSRRLTVAISANRAGALPPEVRAARTELLALAGTEVDPDLGLDHPPPADVQPGRARLVTAQPHLLGGEASPSEGPMVQVRWVPPGLDSTPGPGEVFPSNEADAGADQTGHAGHVKVAGATPLLLPYPPRLRLAQANRPEVGCENAPLAASGHPSSPKVWMPPEPGCENAPPAAPGHPSSQELGLPLGIDLERDQVMDAPADGPFWILGRARSGRSTSLTSLAAQLASSSGGSSVLVSCAQEAAVPRHLWNDVLDHPPDAQSLGQSATDVALVAIDDAHRLNDDGWAALDRWLEALKSRGGRPLVALVADPATLDRWNPVVTTLLGYGSGLLLAPEPDEDGRLLGGDLPRHRPFAMSAGRGFLIRRGVEARPVQVAWPHS